MPVPLFYISEWILVCWLCMYRTRIRCYVDIFFFECFYPFVCEKRDWSIIRACMWMYVCVCVLYYYFFSSSLRFGIGRLKRRIIHKIYIIFSSFSCYPLLGITHTNTCEQRQLEQQRTHTILEPRLYFSLIVVVVVVTYLIFFSSFFLFRSIETAE